MVYGIDKMLFLPMIELTWLPEKNKRKNKSKIENSEKLK